MCFLWIVAGLRIIFLACGPAAPYIIRMRFLTSKPLLIAELLLFMLGVPLMLTLVLPPKAILPTVWLMALVCHLLTRATTGKSLRHWWNAAAVTKANLKPILLQFLVCAVLLGGLTWWLKPELLFGLIRDRPQLWIVVMVLYPVLSVVPQEIIFRSYLFARFSMLLHPSIVMVVVSGLGFGFAHIVFGNWVAPVLCAIGGMMFARTYQKTRSLALVSLEHALFGDFIFTLGLGRYFYHGAIPLAH